ncbi:MAG: helix-turn-helix domain-containing protein [Chloroflexi bacterium]|nr:helix-turn-helix domain-containing protein [Chloroflexota bacterium]
MALATRSETPKRRARKQRPDFLDEIIAEGAREDPQFPQLVQAAYERRELLRRLVRQRDRAGLTQSEVAERMKTSQAAIARIESGDFDVRTSTLDRYALAVGKRISYRLSAAR